MADSPRAPLGVEGEKFGEVAVREKFATPEQVRECAELQARLLASGSPPRRLGDLLVEKGYLTAGQADAIARLLAARNPAAHSSSKMMAAVGFRIPGYELIERIGQGAMGSVFKARQLSMDRIVAVKVLNLKRGGDPSFIERFEREARSVGQLNHPNIIQGIEVGEVNGLHYLVMEYVDGEPISSLLHRQGPMAEKRCLQIALQIARALEHAAGHGVIHRDVKPENIMLARDGSAKLCDLGLAKQTRQEGANLTMEGITVGTPNYISPEQARGESNIDARSDIYSLGATLYHMATGVPPFDGPNPMAIMTKHVTDPVDPPIRRVPGLSPGFNSLILKMLMKRREDRYQDARQLAADLQILLKGGAIAAPRAVTRRVALTPTTPPRRPSPLPYVLAACGALVAIVGAIWILKRGGGKAVADGPSPAIAPQKPTPIPEGPDDGARREQEMRNFREYCDALWEKKEHEWIRRIYDRGEQRLSDYAHKPSEAEWLRLVSESRARINDWILRDLWKPVSEEAETARSKREFVRAIEAARRFDEEYVHFRSEDGEVLTKAGEEQRRLLERLNDEKNRAYQDDEKDVLVLENRERFEEAFAKIAEMARRYGGGEDLLHLRKQGLQKLIDSVLTRSPTSDRYVEAQQRLRSLQTTYAEDADFVRLIARCSEDVKTRASDTAFEAAARLPGIYREDFEPAFKKALMARDLLAARRLLFEVYLGERYGSVRGALRAENLDPLMLRALLDPQRTDSVEYAKVVSGIQTMLDPIRAQDLGAAFDYAMDLRAYALLEELVEQAMYGAKLCGMNESRFAGFEGALKGAVEVATAPRGKDDPWRFEITRHAPGGGKAAQYYQVAPIGEDLNATEEDIVLLSKKSYRGGHENDPFFSLRVGLLYLYKERWAEAGEWIGKVDRAPANFGLQRYRVRLKVVPTPKAEKEADSKYGEAIGLYSEGKFAEALAVFHDLRDRYKDTAFLRAPADEPKEGKPSKPRIQIVLEFIRQLEEKTRPKIEDLFKGTVKMLPGGRIEVTYDFAVRPESAVDFERTLLVESKPDRGGVHLRGGPGYWCWKAPLENNVMLKIHLRLGNEKGIGAVLHRDGDEQGYPAFVDFQPDERPLQGLKGQSLLIRLPVKQESFPNSIIAQKRSVRVKKGDEIELRYIRDGENLSLEVGKEVAVSDRDARYGAGTAGVFLWRSDVLVQKVAIAGKPVDSWVAGELKKLEK